ncbi:hypothetical protein ALC53_03330 [Atta colombica]|uniref:Uncharacterized protein n=1 Tax=Atta colombica TaxID=520822 RepID=A0A195BPK9_9HYME|nr:hypothetical protein ALC53_03330 [Atta colombica]
MYITVSYANTYAILKRVQAQTLRQIPHAYKPAPRSRQFTISKHKQTTSGFKLLGMRRQPSLAGSERWGRDFWDAKRLVRQSLSVTTSTIQNTHLFLSLFESKDMHIRGNP